VGVLILILINIEGLYQKSKWSGKLFRFAERRKFDLVLHDKGGGEVSLNKLQEPVSFELCSEVANTNVKVWLIIFSVCGHIREARHEFRFDLIRLGFISAEMDLNAVSFDRRLLVNFYMFLRKLLYAEILNDLYFPCISLLSGNAVAEKEQTNEERWQNRPEKYRCEGIKTEAHNEIE
jgi:hypothetical protein